jgi:hypothetical protein
VPVPRNSAASRTPAWEIQWRNFDAFEGPLGNPPGRATLGYMIFFILSGGASGLSVPYKMSGQHAHSAGNCLVAAIVPVPREIAPASPSRQHEIQWRNVGCSSGNRGNPPGPGRMGCMFFIQWRCFDWRSLPPRCCTRSARGPQVIALSCLAIVPVLREIAPPHLLRQHTGILKLAQLHV